MIFADGEEPVGVRVLTYQSSRSINTILNALNEDEIRYLRESSYEIQYPIFVSDALCHEENSSLPRGGRLGENNHQFTPLACEDIEETDAAEQEIMVLCCRALPTLRSEQRPTFSKISCFESHFKQTISKISYNSSLFNY
ncbi:hypothetical protein IGI04_034823 [Brassica rapa subsp. trilocularis]|uniref:Uncharacterized protein n=1 Tax=Brassica rapa subsp. trilocularis TaxID=1813537 RepID=A0ABQ7LD16_BRACM|nr:hypothetical protein IGI04_034823 [Brassica rapa subsp. trilocularis]